MTTCGHLDAASRPVCSITTVWAPAVYRLTNRWEASLWLNGRQLYLGGFDSEEDAARAYDLVALACKGLHVATNFGQRTYADELVLMEGNTQVPRGPAPLRMPLPLAVSCCHIHGCNIGSSSDNHPQQCNVLPSGPCAAYLQGLFGLAGVFLA